MRELFLLDPSVVYLNHGSFGACPRPVFEAYQGFQRELERQPVEFLGLERRFPALLEEARLELAAYVGARPDNLVFATNASSALNTVIRSLPLGPGDEVLLGDAEYGGLEILWRHIAERTGATLRFAPFASSSPARTRASSSARTSSGRLGASTISRRSAQRRAQQAPSRSSTAPMRRARSSSTSPRSTPTSMPATATSGCARRRAPPFSTYNPPCRNRSSRSSSRGTGSTARRSTSGTAGRARATRPPSSPSPPRSRSRRSTTGRPCARSAGHC